MRVGLYGCLPGSPGISSGLVLTKDHKPFYLFYYLKVKYCSQPCQKLHWFTHKKNCKTLAEQFEKAALIEKELVENEHAKEASIREKEAPHEEEASADEKEVPHQEVDVNDKEEKEDGIALESGQLTDDKMCENIVESIGNNVKQE